MEPARAEETKIDATLVAMPTQRPKSRPDVKLRPKTTPTPKPKTVTEPATQPKAKKNSASRNAQLSAGTGSNVEAGKAGQSRVATATKGNQDKLRAVWGSRIRSEIERNKRYPLGSNNSGKVTLTLTVSRGGRLQDVRVAKSSGYPTLDQTALLIVKKSGPFTKVPKKISRKQFQVQPADQANALILKNRIEGLVAWITAPLLLGAVCSIEDAVHTAQVQRLMPS